MNKSRLRPKLIKSTYRGVKNTKSTADKHSEQPRESTPENYATERLSERGEQLARFGADKAKSSTRRLAKKLMERARDGGATRSSFSSGKNATDGTKFSPQSAKNANTANTTKIANSKQEPTNVARNIQKATNTVRKTRNSLNSAKVAVKTTKNSVKTGKVAVKTTAQTAKVAAKTSAHAVKTSIQTSRLAVKLAITTAKVAARVAVATAKALATAVKALIAFLVAGGWVVALVVLIVAIIMLLMNSIFGVFAANETADGSKPMTEAIKAIQIEYEDAVDAEIAPHKWGADEIHIDYGDSDGDSDIPTNWNDTLAIYSVIVTLGETPTTTAMVTPENIAELEDIFYTMHSFTCTAEETTGTDEEGNEITIVHIDVDFEIMSAQTATEHFAFDESEQQMLAVMTDPSMMSLYADLLGVDIYGGATSADITDIISNLPPNEKSTIIVEAALGKLGVAYSKMDCSDLSEYAYAQAGIDLPGTAAAQAKYCYENGFNVGIDELQPGDLIFWQKKTCSCGRWNEIHHVGIYVGDGMIVDASSSKGGIVYREIWGEYGSTWAIHSYARPT